MLETLTICASGRSSCRSRIRDQAATGSWTKVPAVGDPTDIVQLRTGDSVSIAKVNGVGPPNDAWLRAVL